MKSRWFAAGAILALTVLSLPGLCHAHRVGESYVMLSSFPDRMEGRLEATLQDLDVILSLDTDGDGKISEAEFELSKGRITEYLSGHLTLWADGEPTKLEYTTTEPMTTDLGRFAVVSFRSEATIEAELSIEYTGFFEQIPEHRGFFIIEYEHSSGTRNETEAVSLVFTPDTTLQVIDPTVSSSWTQFLVFVRQGTHHIWIGVDHILFLVVLILPAVMTRRDGSWHAVESFRPALIHVVKVVSLFTLAHSITLSLAALGIVNLQSRIVESIIAASVVVAAINGGFLGLRIWPVIFLFGLFHGFGFASVLGHLALDRRFLVPALTGFNVGVEIGQVVIILATFPVLWLLRRWQFYPGVVLRGASAAIAALALVWLAERAFDITLLGLF